MDPGGELLGGRRAHIFCALICGYQLGLSFFQPGRLGVRPRDTWQGRGWLEAVPGEVRGIGNTGKGWVHFFKKTLGRKGLKGQKRGLEGVIIGRTGALVGEPNFLGLWEPRGIHRGDIHRGNFPGGPQGVEPKKSCGRSLNLARDLGHNRPDCRKRGPGLGPLLTKWQGGKEVKG